MRHWLTGNPDGVLPFTQVRQAIGGMDASNFNKLRQHQDFVDGLEAEGIKVPRRYARGFRYALEEVPSEGEFEDFFPAQNDIEGC